MANIEALKQLYRVVQGAPDDLFHMRRVVEESSCGTARCALGWALIDPWFLDNTEIAATVSTVFTGSDSYLYVSKVWELSRVFDLSMEDTNNIFALDAVPCNMEEHSVSKEEVLQSIAHAIDGYCPFEYDAVRKSKGLCDDD